MSKIEPQQIISALKTLLSNGESLEYRDNGWRIVTHSWPAETEVEFEGVDDSDLLSRLEVQ